MPGGKGIAYYVSSHGYGHGARSLDIIAALQRRCPGLPGTLVSGLPEAFLRSRPAGRTVGLRAAAFDVGMVQLDALRVDVPETLRRVEALYRERAGRVAAEAAWLRDAGITAVVTDIPALPLEAARRAGLPAVAVSNFSWDWIYEPFVAQDARWAPLVQAFREGYACADLLLRLPFHDALRAFRRIEDVPLVASPGADRRRELAARLRCSADKRWVLLVFTALDLSPAAVARLVDAAAYEFITVLPLRWAGPNLHAVDPQAIPFADLVATVDLVVSKPGFGIMSECAVNRKTLVYAERTDYAEYTVLEQGVRRHLRHVHIPAADLYAGRLEPYLARAVGAPEPREPIAADGGDLAARRILKWAGIADE